MKITLAMATYNRREYLETTIASLQKVEGLAEVHVRIYDDASTEYGVAELQSMIPFAREIVRREQNIGACKNMMQIYRDFLTTGDDFLWQIDSDMIFHRDALRILQGLATRPELAIYSVYNSDKHECGEQSYQLYEDLVFHRKNTMGGACVLFPRAVVERIVDFQESQTFDLKISFDYHWSRYLHKIGIPMYVSRESYVQHIGIMGIHSWCYFMDRGLNFTPSNIEDAIFLNQQYEGVIRECVEEYAPSVYLLENSFARKLLVVYAAFRDLRIRIKKFSKDLKNNSFPQ